MNLEGYLEVNEVLIGQESVHALFLDTLCKNLEQLGIKPPYRIFREVRLRGFKREELEAEREIMETGVIPEDFYRQADLVVLNSGLYVIEAKVIRTNNHEKKEAGKIRVIRRQLAASYAFFKETFKVNPLLIGAYRRLFSGGFHYYYQNPDGSAPHPNDILKVACQ